MKGGNIMKTEQEMNNLRMTVAEDRKAVNNFTSKLDAARKMLYHNSVILYKAENNIDIGDTVEWVWKTDTNKYGFEGINDEPLPEPIGEIFDITCTDYTGILLHIRRGGLLTELNNKTTITKVIKAITH